MPLRARTYVYAQPDYGLNVYATQPALFWQLIFAWKPTIILQFTGSVGYVERHAFATVRFDSTVSLYS